jgi:hypothetical protein|uniref:Uncharacterized protein n=1 Tax=viral metagenome TaxID=1070528 RepID=A0A6C0D0V1_9ZZZZ
MGNTFTTCFKCCYVRKPRPLIEEYELDVSQRDIMLNNDVVDKHYNESSELL